MTEEQTGKGSDANYCSAYPDEGHHMSSHSAGQKVRFVERCSFCGWIDGAALDGYADNAIKEALSQRAQRIALASETQPFAFVQQQGDPDLTLDEIIGQALAAASMCWEHPEAAGVFDSTRAARIYQSFKAELERMMRLDRKAALDSSREQSESLEDVWRSGKL